MAPTASLATYADLEAALRARLGEGVLEAREDRGQLVLKVPPSRRPDALRAAKELGFTFYAFCAPVDWPKEGRIEVLDHVYCIERRQRLTIRCDLPRDAPRCPSAVAVYAGADWHEREGWELFGVQFTGHPNLRRLLLPDWFEGFPMRKDYQLPARAEKPWPGESFKPE